MLGQRGQQKTALFQGSRTRDILRLDVEGISKEKSEHLSKALRENKIDVVLLEVTFQATRTVRGRSTVLSFEEKIGYIIKRVRDVSPREPFKLTSGFQTGKVNPVTCILENQKINIDSSD